MMAFMPILFYIVFFAIIINAKKQEKSGKGQNRNNASGNLPHKSTGKYTISEEKKLRNGEKSGSISGTGKIAKSNIPKKQTAVPNVPRKKEKRKTFLEPHKEETMQPKIRTNNLWGEDKYANKRIVALRLMEGDPVPQGYVVVRCPYCAAENLVTQNCKEYHSCYFCRVPID